MGGARDQVRGDGRQELGARALRRRRAQRIGVEVRDLGAQSSGVDRPAIRSYRDLVVWQKAMRLVAGVYELTRTFRKSRDHGLGGQMRRAALSVASNIAEGHGRDHLRDYLRHLSIAKGSLSEVETQLLTARAVGTASARELAPLLALCDEIGRMLTILSRRLKQKLAP
jgi:four helix bundle protein